MKKIQLSRQTRITILLVIDIIFFIVEISVGYYINSLALIVDSFHLLNDVLSLIVAFYALKLASKSTFSPQYSYGWQRAEVLGALINGVFLMALCFSIFVETIQRFFEIEEISNPQIIFWVGCAGLATNIIGLLLFHEHGHGHSHGSGTKSEDNDKVASIDEILVHPAASRLSIVKAAKKSAIGEVEKRENDNCNDNDNDSDSIKVEKLEQVLPQHDKHDKHDKHDHNHGDLNMRGVFLHVLGDALSNIGVIGTGLFIYFTKFSWRFYMDPAISLVLTVFIFSSAFPLVKSASFILLHKVPSGIPIDYIRSEIKKLSGVLSVHELHIWQLSDTKRICSAHVLLAPSADYMNIATSIRKILHSHGIHSITIQPEYVKVGLNSNDSGDAFMVVEDFKENGEVELVANEDGQETACLLRCNLDPSCAQNLCCPPPKKTNNTNHNSNNNDNNSNNNDNNHNNNNNNDDIV